MKKNYKLYVGTYAKENQAGIFQYRIDGKDRTIQLELERDGISNPSYLALSKDGHRLYAVMEDMEFRGKTGGGFSILESTEGKLSLLCSEGTKGTLPCHVLVDEESGYAFVSNYMSGSLSMFALGDNHDFCSLCDFKQHEGKGTHPTRQEGPHVHFSGFSPKKDGLWCVDLGQDKIFYYEIDVQKGCLEHYSEYDITFPGGCGPRHFVINPVYPQWMYVVCELSSEVFVVDIAEKAPRIFQRISTLNTPDAESTCAAIKCSEDGRFVYASNRGDDSIAVYEMDKNTGLLNRIQIEKTRGKSPRDFLVLEDMVLAANQDSNNITRFYRDADTGKLSAEGECIECHAPVCLIAHPEV